MSQAMLILDGKSDELIADLRSQMEKAAEALYGKYVPAVFAALSLAVFTLAVSILEFFFQIRLILLARGIKSSDAAGAGFSGVINACGLKLCLFFIKLIWLVFYEALPAAGAAALIIRIKKEPLSLRAACVAAAGLLVLACAGLLFYGVTVQRYSKSMFFLACYRDFSPLDALRESIKKTKGGCYCILGQSPTSGP